MGLTQTQVSELYISIFGRASEGAGNEYWMGAQDAMAPAADVMLATVAATAYFGDSLDSNQAFIEHIYTNTLGKTYADDSTGIDYWVGLLDDGMPRGQVLASLVAAAQDDANAGDAQDQFNNRVLVSNYAADMIDTFTDFPTFTGFISGVDHTQASVLEAKALVDALGQGQSFTLTLDTDLFDGTPGGDTFTAPSGTLGFSDALIDTSNADGDTLNVSLARDMEGVNEPVIQKIETINVTYDHLSGAVTAFDATNVSGANINMHIGRAIDGTARVVDAGLNNVTAGTGVETLVVTNVVNGVIAAGDAGTVIVDDAQTDGNRITIVVNGDLNLMATTEAAVRFTVNAWADAVVDLDSTTAGTASFFAGTDLFFGGDFDILVRHAELLDGLTTTDLTGAGTLIAEIAGNAPVNAVDWSFDRIVVSSDLSQDGAVTLSVKNNDKIDFDTTQTATTILENQADTLAANIYISTGEDQTQLIFDSTNGRPSATRVYLTATADITLAGLTDAQGEGELVITGADSVVIKACDFAYVDASGLTGAFDFTAAADAYVTGSETDANTIDAGTFDLIYQGGAGADEVDARTAATSTLIAALGDGDDRVLMDDTLADGSVTIDFGQGTDTLWLGNDTEFSGIMVNDLAAGSASTHSWLNLEKIELENISADNDTVRATINAGDVSGKSIEIFTEDPEDTAEFGLYADHLSVNLSRLTLTNIDGVYIQGSGEQGAVIIATNTDDTIDTGNGNVAAHVTLVTGDGDDRVVMDHLGSGVSAGDVFDENSMVSLVDYSAAEDSLDNDTLDLPGELSVLADITVADGLDVADATVDVEDQSLNAVVTDGILTLDNDGGNTIYMDTLAEWVAAASLALDQDDTIEANYDVVAFEFNGNTYVVTHDDSGGAADDAFIDNVVELTGLTGVAAVSDIAGVNTILIA